MLPALLVLGSLLWLLVCGMAFESITSRSVVPNVLRTTFTMNLTSVYRFFQFSSLLSCVEVLLRYQDVEAFYTNIGVFPVAQYDLICSQLGACDFSFDGSVPLTTTDFSLHLASGDVDFQKGLFVCTFLLGLWTVYHPKTWRLAGLYVLISSMHRRNHFINDKGSETLRIMLLWSTLLSFKVGGAERVEAEKEEQEEQEEKEEKEEKEDKKLVKEKSNEKLVKVKGSKEEKKVETLTRGKASTTASGSCAVTSSTSFSTSFSTSISTTSSRRHMSTSATVGFIFQVGMIYWFSAWYKYAPSADDSWSSGKALDLSLGLKTKRTTMGEVLLSMPPWVRMLLTHASGAIEIAGPFLFMSPYYTQTLRGVGVLCFVGFHLGIGTAMDLGIFPLYSCFLMVPLVPGSWWEMCRCGGGVRGVRGGVTVDRHDAGSQQSGTSRTIDTSPAPPSSNSNSDNNSNKENHHDRSYAWNRSRTRDHWTTTFVQQLFIVVVSLLIFWWQAFNFMDTVPMPKFAREACAVVGLKQHWKLFTNMTVVEDNFDCRPAMIGVLSGGQQLQQLTSDPTGTKRTEEDYINLLRWFRQELETTTPEIKEVQRHSSLENSLRDYSGGKQMPSTLWERWMEHIRSNDFLMMSTGSYFCRKWRENHRVQLIVTMDRKDVAVKYGIEEESVVKYATEFCHRYHMTQEECTHLYNAMKRKADDAMLVSYHFLSVCDGGVVHGIKHMCDTDVNGGGGGGRHEIPTTVRFQLNGLL